MIEATILSSLIHNEKYTRKVLPYLKPEYFSDQNEQFIFSKIAEYVNKYNGIPPKDSIYLIAEKDSGLSEERYKAIVKYVHDLDYDKNTNFDWLIDNTEDFCQQKSIYNAIRKSILILDGKSKENLDKGSIPKLLTDALSVTFDSSIGHDYIEDFSKRYEFYHTKENKIEFDLDIFNNITKGGVSRKALIVGLAGTGVGKTLFMTHNAAANLMYGYNVLYITLEMAEEKIAERIDANLLDMSIDDLHEIDKSIYASRVDKIKSKTKGKLIVKEYPTASVGAAHFRHLINELRIKKNFVPDIIYVDYLNLCISSRIKYTAGANSYTLIKAIAEELRGLAVEFNVPVFTATQTTRRGFSN